MSIENINKKIVVNNLSSYKNSLHKHSPNMKNIVNLNKHSYNKNINNIKIFTYTFSYFKISDIKGKDFTINKHKISKSSPQIHFDIKNFENIKKEIKMKNRIKNEPYFRKIYSNELIEFKNEITKKSHYMKKYKEDDISFTKNNINNCRGDHWSPAYAELFYHTDLF